MEKVYIRLYAAKSRDRLLSAIGYLEKSKKVNRLYIPKAVKSEKVDAVLDIVEIDHLIITSKGYEAVVFVEVEDKKTSATREYARTYYLSTMEDK